MASVSIDVLTVIDKVLWIILSTTCFHGDFSVPSGLTGGTKKKQNKKQNTSSESLDFTAAETREALCVLV